MYQDDTGDYGKQQESGITPAEIEALVSTLRGAARRLKEIAHLYASTDETDQFRAREALLIIEKRLAGLLAAFRTKVEQ